VCAEQQTLDSLPWKKFPEISLARDSIWQQPTLMGGMNK